MCGITGWLSRNPITEDQVTVLDKMIDCLDHRGPDGKGKILFNNAALGHTRLSIIDLQSGQQPMRSHDERFTIVYNGEIYNYPQLRQELLASGSQFNSHSDTEVIIEIYRKYGIQGFSRLRGMYAFTLWDDKNKHALLARDPLGIKPLFYHIDKNSNLTFGSEAKAIFPKLGNIPALDEQQLHLLLNFRYLPGESTLFNSIQQLAPGTILSWQPESSPNFSKIAIPEETGQNTLEELKHSISLHLTSDVEVGCYLSGGIDSATILALSKDKTGYPIKTFTLDVGDDPNEAKYADETADFFQAKNLQSNIDGNINQDLQTMLWHLEVPKINALQNYQLAKFASRDIKVALSGLGGDELFMGYNAHKIMLQTYTLHKFLPSFFSTPIGNSLQKLYSTVSSIEWTETERSFGMLSKLGNWPYVYGLIRNIWDSPKMRNMVYGERMLSSPLTHAYSYLEDAWPKKDDPVEALAHFEWHHKLVNDLLWQEDRVSMAHGLEVRTPFVDARLYSHMQRFSRNKLMSSGKPKGYMKQVVSPIVPGFILNRPKSGFQLDAHSFFHNQLKSLIEEHLNERQVKEHGLFNYDFIKKVAMHPPSKSLRWHYFLLFFMVQTHMWLQVFSNKN